MQTQENTFEIIDEILADWMDNKKSFTSYDVALEVSKIGNQRNIETIMRRKMRPYIKECMDGAIQDGLYDKKYVKYNGETAVMFYPVENSSDTIPIQDENENKVQDKEGKKPDNRGTLCIPNHLIKQIGLKAGDKVFLNKGTIDGRSVIILDPAVESDVFYTVDKNSNVRITKHQLNRLLIENSVYEILVESNCVVVSVVE